MSSLEGHSIGRYHVLEKQGEGGMATVYKAYDTRLERYVALKAIRKDAFSPTALEQVLKRFAREAKALSSLSHINIVKVHDYGEYEGAPYLVMEYVSAGTLKERTGTPMPWSEAVRILAPIARALAYAHERGLIHRDVKPSNILINETGDPLLTDFGIAKILEVEETIVTLTGTGMVVGTPEYMAPEQWMGDVVTQTDIYALGIVFYEMVTGRRPYEADTPAALLLKQANDPFPQPKKFVPGLPDDVEQVLVKALAKEPENRFEDMSAFAAALERLAKGMPEALPEPSWASSIPQDTRTMIGGVDGERGVLVKRLLKLPNWAWVAIAMGVLGILCVWSDGVTEALSLLGFADGQGTSTATLTPSTTAIPEVLMIFTQTTTPTTTPEPTEVPPTLTVTPTPTETPYPSPVGRIAFVSYRDGNEEIYVMNADGSDQTRLTNDPAEDKNPVWSPRGERIAFTSNRGDNWDIYVMDMDGSRLARLTDDPGKDGFPEWSPDGGRIAFEAFRDGNLEIYVINTDGSGQARLTDDPAGDSQPAWSPDGTRIAFVSNRDGNSDIYVINPDGSNLSRLTYDAAPDADPKWSPDGSQIAFRSWRDGNAEIYVMNADGSAATRITNYPSEDGCLTWSPDGNYIAFCSDRDGNWEIYLIDISQGSLSRLTNSEGYDGYPVWSPDGLYIAFQSDRDGNIEIYTLALYLDRLERLTFSDAGPDSNPVWAPR